MRFAFPDMLDRAEVVAHASEEAKASGHSATTRMMGRFFIGAEGRNMTRPFDPNALLPPPTREDGTPVECRYCDNPTTWAFTYNIFGHPMIGTIHRCRGYRP